MDHPLLKEATVKRLVPAGAMLLVVAFFGGCTLFDDPIQEIDPALVHDSSFTYLATSEARVVTRVNLLESFGAYGCSGCPDAESRLSPYLDSGSPSYRPNLVIVNYHVDFPSTLTDPWITAATQARQDAYGFTSLPQVKLNGSNAPYGIREKDVRYAQGEYDSLIHRLRRTDTLSTLDFALDTTLSRYDSASRRLIVRFSVLNRSTAAQGALSFRVLAVKNLPVTIPTLPNHPWQVIVAETTERDTTGALLSLARMPALTAKTWTASLTIPLETERTPAPSLVESPSGYALILVAKDASGIVQNAFSWHFRPQ